MTPDITFAHYIGGLAGFIAFACGWSLCWQLLFGEFDGAWGQKENRGTLAITFVVSAVVASAILSG